MPTSAQNRKPQPSGISTGQWTTTQAYILAVITLVIGVGIGWIIRGAGSNEVHPAEAAAANPRTGGMPSMGNGAMPPGQLPGFGQQQQQKPSIEEVNKAAEPMLMQLKQNPNDPDLLAKIGNLYYDGQAYPQAVDYYRNSLKINPKNVDVRTDMATCIWYAGDPDGAIKEFEKSLSYNPTHPGTLFNMGVVKWQGKSDPKGAVAAWEKLLQTNPNYPERQKVESLVERAKMHGDQSFGKNSGGNAGKASPFPTPF